MPSPLITYCLSTRHMHIRPTNSADIYPILYTICLPANVYQAVSTNNKMSPNRVAKVYQGGYILVISQQDILKATRGGYFTIPTRTYTVTCRAF